MNDLREAFEVFLETKSASVSDATLLHYETAVTRFIGDTGARDFGDMSVLNVARFLKQFTETNGYSPATRDYYHRGLRVFGNFLYRHKLIDINPFKELPPPRKNSRREPIRTLSKEEFLRMLKVVRSPGRQHRERDVAMLMLLLDTGIRVGELANLMLDDIDWEHFTMTVSGKTGRRVVPFSKKAKHHLTRYVNHARRAAIHERALFVNRSGKPLPAPAITDRVRKIGLRARVSAGKLGPHTLRHTFAYEFIRCGGDPFSLQAILGHSSQDQTAVYVQMTGAKLRDAHERFSPLRIFS